MRNMFKGVLIIVIILIIIILSLHYRKYIVTTEKYEILQQELDNVVGYSLYTNKDPMIITFIEDSSFKINIDKYSLKTAITISENYFDLNIDKYYYNHNYEICLIRPLVKTVITLINPKFNSFFNGVDNDYDLNKFELLDENFPNVKSIDIVLHRHNIFCLPRFWLFKFKSENKIEMFTTHNIFTKFFSFFK